MLPGESQTRSSKQAPRELQNWRVQGNLPTMCQPCVIPLPTFRQLFANLFCQPLSKPLFPWTPGAGLETRVNGFLDYSAGPKRGCLNVGGSLKSAGKRQESATFLQRSLFNFQCSFTLAAAQLLVKMTSALQKSECCSATSAAQLSENCSATSVFACAMLQGWGL